MPLSTKEYKQGLNKTESFLLSSLARADRNIFSLADARKIIRKNTKELMHSLIEKKWVLQLKRGLYVIVPLNVGVKGADSFVVHNFIIASYLVEPYYIGFWSALNYHGLSDQIPSTTFIATTQAKKSIEILNSEYKFVKLGGNKFFGITEVEIEGKKIKISNPEKTMVDCLDHPEHAGGIDEVAKSIYFSQAELDFTKIRNYAEKMRNLTILKRFGFILEKTKLLDKYEFAVGNFKPSKGYPALDKLSPKKGKYNSKWGLLINRDINPEGWLY